MLVHGEILDHDPFRFTSGGAPWVDHEWLFQGVLAVVDAIGGIPALVGARTAYAILLALLLWWLARREGASPLAATLLAGLALTGARPRFALRPELATIAGLAILLGLLRSARDRGDWKPVAAMVGVTVVWVNFHPGALIAPGIVGLYFAGLVIDAWKAGDRGGALAWAARGGIAATAVGAALLANPFGFHVVRVPIEISRALEGLPGYNPDWLASWEVVRPLYVLALSTLALGWIVARRRRATPDGPLSLVALAMAGLSFWQGRQQPLFWIAGATLAASLVGANVANVWSRRERFAGRLAGVTVLLLVSAWALRPFGPWAGLTGHLEAGTGIQAGLFPEAAVDELERSWSHLGPLYHDMAFGGYLLWRTYPPRQIFWDSRNELDPGLLREVGRARQDGRLWFGMLEKYAIDGALVRYDRDRRPEVEMTPAGPRVVGRHTPNALFFPRARFALVYWDDLAMLLVRRTPERERRLRAIEYRFVDPEDWLTTLARAERDPEFREAVRNELERRLGESPRSRRAERMLDELMDLPPGPRGP